MVAMVTTFFNFVVSRSARQQLFFYIWLPPPLMQRRGSTDANRCCGVSTSHSRNGSTLHNGHSLTADMETHLEDETLSSSVTVIRSSNLRSRTEASGEGFRTSTAYFLKFPYRKP
jgi:hypothetical protein